MNRYSKLIILFYAVFLAFVYHYHIMGIDNFHRIKLEIEAEGEETKAYLGDGWSTVQEIKGDKVVFPVKDKTILNFNLQEKDAFLMEVKTKKGKINNSKVRIFVNGEPVSMVFKQKHRFYYKIPEKYTNAGENEVRFAFSEPAGSITFARFKFRNYIGYSSNFPKGFILFDDSGCLKSIHSLGLSNLVGIAFLFLYIYLFLFIGSNLVSGCTKLELTSIYRNGLLSFLPGIFLLFLVVLLFTSTPYHIIFDIWTFILFCFILPAFVWIILMAGVLSKTYRIIPQLLMKLGIHFKNKKKFFSSSKTYILGFMVLLVICAFLLIFKAEKIAEQVANVAYFLLAIGVGIELYSFIKHKDSKNV